VELRRAGLTPGKDRRRSGKQQRDTPRDTLRLLSRTLAPKSLPVVPTPDVIKVSKLAVPVEEEEDGPDPERPRLSLPFGDEDDEDDSLLLPPRSAGLEDENFTIQSVELPRRALSEQPPGRLSRGSFGSIRMSDVFPDLHDAGLDGLGGDDSSYMAGGYSGDDVGDIVDDVGLQG